ncbi:MAG: hypothetical protein DWQ02_07780 [Bacteroidetes bacterium]|nr:MAG: hypothetical protein DWQ02_07780 [Bacteroidota bacterium]
MDAYEWAVGSDPTTFTDSVFFLNFYGIEGDITVTLKTYLDQPDVTCFPQDTGFAEVSKSIFMKPGIHEIEGWPIFGLFEGADEDAPEDIYTVDFMPFFNNYIKNFPYGCERTGGVAIHLTTPRAFTLFGQDYNIHDCWDPKGEGFLLDDDNNTLVIEYSMEDPSDPSKRINKKFI